MSATVEVEPMRDRVAIVTGAAGAIGQAICARFAAEGATVVVTDADEPGARETAAALAGDGARSLALRVDVRQRGDWDEATRRVLEAFGRIDILVSNAGITRDALLKKMTDDQWAEVIDVHLTGTFLACQAVIGPMSEAGYGRIVTISSTGYLGNIGSANYSAAKGGIISLTRTVALEGARYGITANAVAPWGVDTPLVRSVPEKVMAAALEQHPLKRLATVEEVAAAVRFLASQEASYISGQVIHVCGGATVGG
jgi:3-oxoacyl-[acyl-carrier protein] reductase